MNDKEILDLLNSLDYDSNEIEELEKEALIQSPSIGESLYQIQNDKVLKDIAFITLEEKVKSLLNKDEEIKYKLILLQSYLENEIIMKDIGAFGGKLAVYIGIFITNKRIFSFRMDSIYNLLDEYSNDLSNLISFSDLWNEYETIGLKFSDDKEILPRPFGKENKELFLDMIKYLNENLNLEFKEYKEPKKSFGFWLLATFGIVALTFIINILIETIKFILNS